MSGEPVTEPVTDPGAPGRARDPDGAARPDAPGGDGEDRAEAAEGDGEAPPVNGLWREHQDGIAARIGRVEFDCWFRDAIPHSDKNGVYVLAVPSAFHAERVNSQYSRILAGILGRREVRAEFHEFAKVAAYKRKQAGGSR